MSRLKENYIDGDLLHGRDVNLTNIKVNELGDTAVDLQNELDQKQGLLTPGAGVHISPSNVISVDAASIDDNATGATTIWSSLKTNNMLVASEDYLQQQIDEKQRTLTADTLANNIEISWGDTIRANGYRYNNNWFMLLGDRDGYMHWHDDNDYGYQQNAGHAWLGRGNGNNVWGEVAVLFGTGSTIVNGTTGSIINGDDNMVYANNSVIFADGSLIQSRANKSFLAGKLLCVTKPHEVAVGQCNFSHFDSNDYEAVNGKNTLFTVGAGIRATASNAIEVMRDGTVYINGVGNYAGRETHEQDASIVSVAAAIAAKQDQLTAGDNISISSGVISAVDTKYTAGTNVTIENGVINAVDTTYSAGENVQINNGVISATDTKYTAGDNISINGGVISATDTKYTAGTGIQIVNGVISADSEIDDLHEGTGTTYSSSKIIELTQGLGFDIEIVTGLPATGNAQTIYMVPKESSAATDVYEEYVYTNNAWEKIGSTSTDLSNYYTKSQVDTLLAGKQQTLTAGSNVQIVNGVISATDTTYDLTPYALSADVATELAKKQNTLTAGTNVQIVDGVISATDTQYTAGANIAINNGVISATDTTYTAGAGISIESGVIASTVTPGAQIDDSATASTTAWSSQKINTELANKQNTLTAGTNVQIVDGVISATDTTYSAGTNVQITNGVISATGNVASTMVATLWAGTQQQYDAITTKDPNTLYIIQEAS